MLRHDDLERTTNAFPYVAANYGMLDRGIYRLQQENTGKHSSGVFGEV